MFFLFGWGRQTTADLGPTLPVSCPNCSNQTWFHLQSYTTWFSLFFVPVFPYDTKNVLLCPICSRGIELGADQVEKAKQLNRLANAFLAKEIPEIEYLGAAQRIKLLPAIESARTTRAELPDVSTPPSESTQALPQRKSDGPVPVLRIIAIALIALVAATIVMWSTQP